MDDFTRNHLEAWAERFFHDDERAANVAAMLRFLVIYPELVDDGHAWPEIWSLAHRSVTFAS